MPELPAFLDGIPSAQAAALATDPLSNLCLSNRCQNSIIYQLSAVAEQAGCISRSGPIVMLSGSKASASPKGDPSPLAAQGDSMSAPNRKCTRLHAKTLSY